MDDTEQHIPPVDVLRSVFNKGFSEEMISDCRGRDFQSFISGERDLLFMMEQGNDVTASSSICDKERSLEDDYDVSKDNRDIGSDLDFDFDDLCTIERFLKPVEHLDDVFVSPVDSFCSRVSFVKVEDHLELDKETMHLSADSILDLIPNKTVDLEVGSQLTNQLETIPVICGQKDSLFDDGSSLEGGDHEHTLKFTTVKSFSECREGSGEKKYLKSFREKSTREEMDLLHWDDFHRKKVKGADDTFFCEEERRSYH